jgi:uncharacterized protein (TIGR02996 family)
MTMTDREALFRAILADPDDDTLRLIYADALEEAGQARRAAFVRTQVQLAGVPEYDPAHIRARHSGAGGFDFEWLQEATLPDGLDWAREPFRRGFPAAVQARDAAAFVAGADELFARYPVESVELRVARPGEAAAFAGCEWVSRLVRLAVTEGLGSATARRLLGSPHYQRLQDLHIEGGLATEPTVTALVGSRVFKQLTALTYRDGPSGGRLVTELTRLADPPRLRALELPANRLRAEQLGPLLAAPVLSAVEELNLSENNLGAAAVRAIAAADLPHLRSLRLHGTRPEQDGVRALAAAAFLPGLRGLTLSGNNLPASAAAVLAGSPGVANLTVLDLRENRLGDRGAAALADSPHLRNLAYLELSQNLIEDGGADALAESPHLGGLICLDLCGNIISPAAEDRLRRRFGHRVYL